MECPMKPFSALRVVELAGADAGSYAGKLFADLGATVIKVEPPGSDPHRVDGARWDDIGTTFAYLNTSKQWLTLDLASDAGASELRALLAGTDVLIESSSPD